MGTHKWPVHQNLRLYEAFYAELRIRPMATSMVVASIYCGVCAFILGEGASRAFTIIGGSGQGGTLIAHSMGALMALGGLVSLSGSLRLGSLVELLGLVFIAAGAAIYGAGVLIGLGPNGLIAGGLALGLAIGAALRVLLLAATASRLSHDDQ